MANQCENYLHVESRDEENINTVLDFISDNFWPYDSNYIDNGVDITFTSKWIFPEELMQKLFKVIPDKSDIFMRCLSVEYGLHYHAIWECNKNGWIEY